MKENDEHFRKEILKNHQQSYQKFHPDTIEVIHRDGSPAFVPNNVKEFASRNLEIMRKILNIPRENFKKVLIIDEEKRPNCKSQYFSIFVLMIKIPYLL